MPSRAAIAAYCILLILYGVIALGVYVNIGVIRVPVLSNPIKPAELSMALDYPPQDAGVANIENIALHIDMTLVAKNPDKVLAAGEPIFVNASGFTLVDMPINASYFIPNITISLGGSYLYGSGGTPNGPNAAVTIFNTADVSSSQETFAANQPTVIDWPVQGIYYPTVIFGFENSSGSMVRTTSVPYSNKVINISPAADLQRVPAGVIINLVAVLLFVYLAGIFVFKEVVIKRVEQRPRSLQGVGPEGFEPSTDRSLMDFIMSRSLSATISTKLSYGPQSAP
jgi:hypothetical protein